MGKLRCLYRNEKVPVDNSDVGMRIIKEEEAISLLKVGFKLGELLKSTTDKVKVQLFYQNQATSEVEQEQSEPLLFEYETGVWQS